ncbi:alpha-L-fucosidase [Algoriphagus halophytocola]|uniref:alpha-L-fucosidase n=2 Tax=Algoriphagus halophytocola TaxID=2991499 RepID=A0ABY6MLX7_9BACT|nr:MULTISPECIES: alpha-L-fucosidase [unclassified Algoriphagus]UZD24767.1 alpha-L-fucosidase [Algoriphagus sp. TR-M5]WBL45158.1 alpha-L-fucosidase [Algoriphagus sp. TR-M9]
MRNTLWFVLLLSLSFCSEKAAPPSPVLPVPEPRQIAWQELEFYGFVHFNMNTFSDREWGFGDEKPEMFNPTDLQPRQWAQVAAEAGMKGLIITAKHHDGFVLWPSEYTEHSIKNSPWKDGKGDLIKELAEACEEYGLKFGIYYSPWDRNHPDYGKPEYITYMRNQLTELLTNYGDIFEVWFDGANGGDGYYGGANEVRKVDKKTYYDWPSVHALVRELQPGAMMFSDAGPDVRWVGNEHGFAYETTWSNLMRDSVYAGMPGYPEKYASGQENGTHWVPAESDVSIRPGWYYHKYEDHKVKTLPELLEIYYKSIGRNSSLLINFPVDTRGLIHENDVDAIMKLANKVKEDFANNLAPQASATASEERGTGYEVENILDGDYETYWSTSDGGKTGEISLDFGNEITFNRLLLQEYTPLGQRVKSFVLEMKNKDSWEKIAEGTTIGYKRILRFPDVTASALRIRITDSKDIPVISELGIYNAPKLMLPPAYSRNKAGEITLARPETGLEVYYTLDGSAPSTESSRYTAPFLVDKASTIKAISVNPESGEKSESITIEVDLAKAKWTTDQENGERLMDENRHSYLTSNSNRVTIDLGEEVKLTGFTYLPMQARYPSGFITNYVFEVSSDGRNFQQVAAGEFSNIVNSPIEQLIHFDAVKGKFIRLTATKTADGNAATFAEIGVLTK